MAGKRTTIAERKKRAAYYIKVRTESCTHCEDLPHLIEAHDILAQKNRALKAKVKELEMELAKLQRDDELDLYDQIMREQARDDWH